MWIYNTDLPTARATQLPSYEAGSAQGIKKAVANGGQLTRASLFKVLRTQETSFDADGITGATNVSGHQDSPCFMITQVKNGQWQRVYPSQAGTFDCKAGNLVTVKQAA